MKKKSLKVLKIKELKKTKNAQGQESNRRFSFSESLEHFCVYTLKEGEQVVEANGVITQVGDVKVGDKIIAYEREVTTADNQTVKQWYLLTNQDVSDYVKAEADRDIDSLVEQEKTRRTAQFAKEMAGFDLAAAMSTV